MAETVIVKYRGSVDLTPFVCTATNSSVVHRVCYDRSERYVVAKIGATYYHYCDVPKSVVAKWVASSSTGGFYNSRIKGHYDCRVNHMPAYGDIPPMPSGRRSISRRTTSCENGLSIESVTSDGAIIKLDDGSVWEVDDLDTVDSALWLETTEITACADKLINTDDNETVRAHRIK
jgi:hypothetical protein